MTRHRITGADPEARTGECSVCGPVTVYKGQRYEGRQYWRCGAQNLTKALARFADDPEAYERYRDKRFLRLYGITLERYDEMVKEQEGLCPRCRKTPLVLRLAVDHNHETGEVRKLLCGPCNTYLGRLEANRDRLMEDLMYLDIGEFVAVSL